MVNKDVIVVGGGAAGMSAAGEAARQGANVRLLERNNRLGMKLMITGKGRCNITNVADTKEIIQNIPGNGKFLYSALHQYSNNELIDFFEKMGVATKVERGGRVFPVSDRAADVVDALTRFIRQNGVEVVYNARVKEICTEGQRVTGVVTTDGKHYPADAVIITTGGASYPLTGSTGDGYEMAEKIGHHVSALRPALVPLETEEEWVKEMQGLSLRNVKLTAYTGKQKIGEEFGEMLFTHFGVSGPIVLTLSHAVLQELSREHQVELSLNLKPALSLEQLDQRLQRDFQQNIRRQFKNAFDELLPRKMIPIFLRLSGIPLDKPVHQITKDERQQLLGMLTDLRFRIKRGRPLAEAIVTAGGVEVREVNPKTMESKLYQGLYWAGEVLDVDGYTGGFNLQAAFSTGFTAGHYASQY